MKFYAKKISPLAIALMFVASVFISVADAAAQNQQQLQPPRPSPKATVGQTIGLTDVTIVYSRPYVKGRVIWGGLVPYNQVWRTGANEATTISFSDDVLINGQRLPAGTYSLHTIPAPDEWTIIFNKVAKQWGSFNYDEKQDALRVKAKPMPAPMHEMFTIEFANVTMDNAQIVLAWDKLAVPFTIETNTKQKYLDKARAALANAKPDDWRTPLQVAQFMYENKIDMNEAYNLLNRSIAAQENYNNMTIKAEWLASEGKYKEAVATGERAIQLAKADTQRKINTTEVEKMVAEWRAKMK
jgi:hypothetical protein